MSLRFQCALDDDGLLRRHCPNIAWSVPLEGTEAYPPRDEIIDRLEFAANVTAVTRNLVEIVFMERDLAMLEFLVDRSIPREYRIQCPGGVAGVLVNPITVYVKVSYRDKFDNTCIV